MICDCFREYDIRANATDELTNDVVYSIGQAFGTFLISSDKNFIVLGKDNRPSSNRISQTFANGLLSTGCNIIDLGETITPILCFSIQYLNVDAGAMVTGSHNPSEYNGIKLQVGEKPLFGDRLRNLLNIIDTSSFSFGKGKLLKYDVLHDYIGYLKETEVDIRRKVRVVIDCANGSTCHIAPRIFKDFGCEVIPLFCDNDGLFPNHHPNPSESKNLTHLIREVILNGAELGISYDGDGNRIGIVDEKGNIIAADILLGLLSRELFAKRGAGKIVCEVKASQSLISDIENRGGRVIMSRVGYPFVLERMFRENAYIAGELTGHICYNEGPLSYGDAIYVSCRLLELLSHSTHSLSQLVSDFPPYISTPEIRIPCSDNEKFKIVDRLRWLFEKQFDINTIDGVRVTFQEQGWALIRASNTEPVLSIRMEARCEDTLKYIKKYVGNQLLAVGFYDFKL